MPNDPQDQNEALSYRDELPLRWLPLRAMPGAAAAERLDEANARLLASVGLLEDVPKLGDDPSPTELELLRIHQKLNLVIDLLGGVLRERQARPDKVPLRLSWRGLSWSGGPLPAVGELGLVELYLRDTLPQPLQWPARVVAAGEGEVSVLFEGGSEASLSALERHVFAHHRREVAQLARRNTERQ